jgi:hypothetical protein
MNMLLVYLFTCGLLNGFSPELTLPSVAADRFVREGIWKSYDLSGRLNPFYLRGDFDGDGKTDYVVLLVSLRDKREAIAYALSSQPRLLIFPREASTFDDWEVLGKGTRIAGNRRLTVEAVVYKSGGPGFVSVWNGKRFDSFRWGD